MRVDIKRLALLIASFIILTITPISFQKTDVDKTINKKPEEPSTVSISTMPNLHNPEVADKQKVEKPKEEPEEEPEEEVVEEEPEEVEEEPEEEVVEEEPEEEVVEIEEIEGDFSGSMFSLTGDATLNLPLGIGKIETEISARWEKTPLTTPSTTGTMSGISTTTSPSSTISKTSPTKKKLQSLGRIVFEAKIKKKLQIAGVTITEPKAVFATDGTFNIQGSATILGKEVIAYLRRTTYKDPTSGKTQSKFEFQGELKSKKPLQPFKLLPIPIVKDIKIENPFIGITLDKFKKVYFGGRASIFNLPCDVKLEIGGAKKLVLKASPPPEGWDLEKISPILAPVKEVLTNFSLITSSYAYYDSDLGINIRPGITFAAKLFPQKIPGLDKLFEHMPIEPQPCVFAGTLGKPKDISFSASLPLGLVLMSQQLYRTRFDIPKIMLKNLQIQIAGIPPEFSFKCAVEVTPRANDPTLLFTGAFTIDLTGQFGIEGSMKGAWINPFGLRGIIIEDVGFEFGARPNPPPVVIIPQRFGFTGTTALGDREDPKGQVRTEITTFLDVKQPQSIVFYSAINHLTLRDIASIPKNLGIPLPVEGVPNLGIQDVEMSFAPLGGVVQVGEVVKNYPMGIRFKGRVEILNKFAEADFNVNTMPGLDMGVKMHAAMSSFNIGPLKITGAGADREYGTQDDGPIAKLALTPKEQELYVSGLVEFFESKGDVEISIDRTGVDVDAKLKIFNVFDSVLRIHSKGGLDFRKLALDVEGKVALGRQLAELTGHIDTERAQLKFFLNQFTLKDSVEAAFLIGAGIRADIKKTAQLAAEELKRKKNRNKIRQAKLNAQKELERKKPETKPTPPKSTSTETVFNGTIPTNLLFSINKKNILWPSQYNVFSLQNRYTIANKLTAQIEPPETIETKFEKKAEEPEVIEVEEEAETKEAEEEVIAEEAEFEKPEETIGEETEELEEEAEPSALEQLFKPVRKKRVVSPTKFDIEIKEEELRKYLTTKESEQLDKILAGLPDIGFKNLKFNLNFAVPDYFAKLAKDFEENGIIYKGTMNIPALKLYGKAFVSIGRNGLIGQASMKKWKFGPLLITGSGEDKIFGTEDDGPYLSLVITPSKQELTISGSANLFGSTGAGIFLDITKDGFTFDLEGKVLNALEAQIHAKTLENYSGFELDGKIRMGRQYERLFGHLGSEMNENVLLFHLNEWSLEGCIETVNDIIEGATKVRPLPAKIIGFFNKNIEYRDVNIGIAGKEIEFEGYKYKPGFTFDAKIVIPYVRIPVRLQAFIDNEGVHATGSLPKINLGPLKVGGAGPDEIAGSEDDGPVISMSLSKNPSFFMDGNVDFFGLKSKTRINISKTSFSFKTEGKFANLFQSYFYVESVGTTTQDFDFIAKGEFKSDFYEEIKKQMRKDVKNFQQGVSKGINKAKKDVDDLNKKIEKLDAQINLRKKRVNSLQKILQKRIYENQQKIKDAQAKVNAERRNVKVTQRKIANARIKVNNTQKQCKKFDKWYSKAAYWGCLATLGLAKEALRNLETGVGAAAEIGLKTAIKALNLAKKACVLNPKNMKENTQIAKFGLEITGLEIAKKTLVASRETAKFILESAKQTTIGLSKVGKGIAEGVLNIEKILDIKQATIDGSLRKFIKKGILPKVTLTVTTLGTTKKASFEFDIKRPFVSIGKIAKGLAKLAFTK